MREAPQAFEIRKGTLAERDRLREIYRDAVLVAGPRSYTREQVALWAKTADDVDRWATWMREGSTSRPGLSSRPHAQGFGPRWTPTPPRPSPPREDTHPHPGPPPEGEGVL